MSNFVPFPAKHGGRGIRFHIISAVVLYLLDALFFGQGVVAFLVMAAFALFGLVKTLALLIKRQPIPRALFIRIGVYVLCFGAVASTIKLNNRIAEHRADAVVSAIKQYKTKYNQFPDSLEALVPEFLPSVPIAKYSFTFNHFYYKRVKLRPEAEENVLFFWTAVPPFGRPSYNFQKGEWVYID